MLRTPTLTATDDDDPIAPIARLGVIMAPTPGNPHEAAGVCNPAGARGRDGAYYLFPRLVAKGNYSRIGIAAVERDENGTPMGVCRLGIAIEPETPDELIAPGVGGCEDARVTYVPCLDRYVMAYVAFGPLGPHVALASSPDLFSWTRHGVVDFGDTDGDGDGSLWNLYANKDAMLLPEPVRAPDGTRCLALLHRPMFEIWDGFTGLGGKAPHAPLPPGFATRAPSMWLSYCPVEVFRRTIARGEPVPMGQHTPLCVPKQPWEEYRIGGGTPPIVTDEGLLTFYHGVERDGNGVRCYRAGALLLDRHDPRRVLARTVTPLVAPETTEEREGVVANVVFPTAVDARAGGYDVYYGMADARIGVMRLTRDAVVWALSRRAPSRLPQAEAEAMAAVRHAS